MSSWLLKTEPTAYSFEDLERDKKTRWDGITNPAALMHLRNAHVGDTVVIYHTGGERRAVGLGRIVRPAYADPKAPARPVVDIAAERRLAKPVELSAIKSDKLFAKSPLVKQGRLSFVPLSERQLARLLELAK
jgi:predicted RNA-binding protein with PUA-like domain